MMTMEYPIGNHHQHKYACSTMSSETLSGSCGSRNNRIRTIRLIKRNGNTLTLGGRNTPSLGFSIRGGHEHGTGFFVSHVEGGSEAHTQGLKVGDQIIRINGFTIEDAIHKEVLQLISTHTHLTLKVRSVGMIPVKDRKTDILSWQIITDTNSLSSRSSPQFADKNKDVRINIMVAPRSKLGCGICKGPDWKPGIFVQFTKEGGIAREAGLRPGDQILQCNNVDFSDIPFNEAVNLMKTSRQLDLLVRKAAASELFPGESSGYNSSASSVTEDQNSSWGDPKRLSIVKEENQNVEDRLLQRSSINKSWTLTDWEEEPQEKNIYKPTIINLSESGTTIKNNGTEYHTKHENLMPNPESKVPEQRESKVVVEVHRSDDDEQTPCLNRLTKSSSNTSLASKTSIVSAASSSLSSAISMEIKRRSEKKATAITEDSIEDQIQKKKLIRGLSSDQQFKHTQLMNEFKQAHQKMFKSTNTTEPTKQNSVLGKDTLDRLAHKELSQKLSDRLLNLANSENNRQDASSVPPPPPPPPSQEASTPSPVSQSQKPPIVSNTTFKPKTKPKAPPVPVKRSVLSCHQPPPCPTPDYDTLSLTSTTSTIKAFNDSCEMDSLESFKINNPATIRPKPPNVYFQKRELCSKLSNGSTTSSVGGVERPKSVNVSIGEYATVRSPPGRLDFLMNKRNTGDFSGGLASELSLTLNKSNLKKRTESMENLLGPPPIRPQSNGTVRISVSNLAKEFAKSTSDLTEDFEVTSKPRNRITININQEKLNGMARKTTYG